MTYVRLPVFLKRLLPQPLAQGLRELKARAVTGGFPRDKVFEQAREDALASASMSIVVPIHDEPTTTRRCLASLEKYAPEAEVILVDDGIANGTARVTKTLEVIANFAGRNGWKVINHENRQGHSEACRTGARLATRPYLCLLNSDTVVTPWCWRPIEEGFEQDAKIGVAGPSSSSSGNTQTLSLAYDMKDYWNDSQLCAFARRLLMEPPQPRVMDMDWVSGFAFFIRLKLWEQLDGFDPKIPDYGNEVDLCNRVAAMGYRRVWIRNSYIHHLGQHSYRELIGVEGMVAQTQAAQIYISQKKRSLAP